MIKQIVISRRDLDLISSIAKRISTEICGMMLGEFKNDKTIVKKIIFGRNVRSSSVEFEMHPEDIYRAIMLAEKNGYEIVALFHSHPGKPIPSISDLEGMRLWPLPWFIFSFEGNYKCFLYDGEEIRELDVLVIDKL